MARTKGMSRGPGSTEVRPKFGMARHRQILKASWASESHDAPRGSARQPAAKRKLGRYGAR
jgi:hypothetical protein